MGSSDLGPGAWIWLRTEIWDSVMYQWLIAVMECDELPPSAHVDYGQRRGGLWVGIPALEMLLTLVEM